MRFPDSRFNKHPFDKHDFKWFSDLCEKFESHEDPHFNRIITFARSAMPVGYLHAIYIILFAFLKLPLLAILNVGSVIFYMFLYYLLRKNRIHTILWLGQVEVLLFSALSVYLAGWESGFYLWLLNMPMLIFTGYKWHILTKKIMIIINFASIVAIIVLGWQLEPYYTISGFYLQFLFYFNILLIFIANAAIAYHLNDTTEKTEIVSNDAHERTRFLLLNILPESVAAKLEKGPGRIADSFTETSILFSDIVEFTKKSSSMTAEEVVNFLDDIFNGFDSIAGELKLEKIKTIGDGYMIAAGVPNKRDDHATAIIDCAFRMLEFLDGYNRENGTEVQLRIGINSGPIVAGVIGIKKFSYDLWGDTVNTASRMESHGIPGKIHISENTYNYVKEMYEISFRDSIDIKGKGVMKTYVVNGKK